jgi:hypothetical protein
MRDVALITARLELYIRWIEVLLSFTLEIVQLRMVISPILA